MFNETPKSLQFLANDIYLNRYQIIKRIGVGGMDSIVYLAEDKQIDNDDFFSSSKYVAIKVINKNENISHEEWIKFLDECVTNTRVTNRPNIISTYDIINENDGNTVVIIMEYVDGISLRKYIEQQSGMPVKEAIRIFKLILNGIKELHSFNDKIIHRDLKPENILLTKDLSNLKIIDFGISAVINKNENQSSGDILTNDKIFLYGTYPYISPDYIKLRLATDPNEKQKFITEVFDFFSLGVILYEMLTGEKPFYADDYENAQEVLRLPLKYDMLVMSDINPNIPIHIENIIFKCIASKSEDIKYRYKNIDEIIDDVNLFETNDLKSRVATHIKPKNKRIFQVKGLFNISGQKTKEKIYEKNWFYLLIFASAVIISVITLTLSLIHEFK